jgi:toxin ParE1/3/4
MARHTKRPEAEADLLEIWLFVARDDPRAADRILDRLEEACDRLAATPGMGVARDRLRPGLRMFPTRGYLIFYHPAPGGIEVVRVLSDKRDVDAVF